MKNLIGLIICLAFLIGCGSSEDGGSSQDNFNRSAMLENWADNIIVPAYTAFADKISALKSATTTFSLDPNTANLSTLRTAWADAYVSWQSVDMFEIGPAEDITFRNYMNVYPLDEITMQQSILDGGYDLTSVNRQDEQGFSALDFLLHGLATTDAEIIAFYTNPTDGSKYLTYLNDLVDRMESLTSTVLDGWTNGYRDTFVSRDGTTATESVNSYVNDYLLYYERFLRAGKIGIPAGVFSGTALSDKVEARFRGDLSKQLYLAALDATQDFFNGTHFNGSGNGSSLSDYLQELNTIKDSEDLSSIINGQFNAARTISSGLSDDLGQQVETNNTLMLETYDELQKNVVYLKVDMIQALNIKVDFVDADGD